MSKEPMVWSVITMRPRGVTSAELGQPEHVRQCRLLARATSRAAFARKLVAEGLENRSVAAVSTWVRDWGGCTANAADLAAVSDDRVYVRGIDSRPGDPYVPYRSPDGDA